MFSKVRHGLHYLAALTLHFSGVLSLRRWWRHSVQRRREVVVLGLHRVLTPEEQAASGSEAAMVILQDTFDRVLDALQRNYTVIGLAQFLDGDLSGYRHSACLLTFDDAWQDTFDHAVPALRKREISAAVFVPTGLIESGETFWVERLSSVWSQGSAAEQATCEAAARRTGARVSTFAEILTVLKQIPEAERSEMVQQLAEKYCERKPSAVDRFMGWSDLLQAGPVLEPGSHTAHHVLLDREEENTARRELTESRATLEARTGRKIRSLAYPNGNVNSQVSRWARESGYEWAFTTRRGVYCQGSDPMQVPRVLLQEGNLTNPWGGFSPAMLHLRMTGWR